MIGSWHLPRLRFARVAFVLLLLAIPLLSVQPAQAFKPYTHVKAADTALLDAQDGTVTINGHDYTVDPRLVQALNAYPQHYRAGVIGPDGFPDFAYGQGIIHPANAGEWMRYILDEAWAAQSNPAYSNAEQLQILAFAYGYQAHAAGDIWAHTFVNDFATGVFPDTGAILSDVDEAAIALRHIIIEGYIVDATAGFDGNPNRTAVGGDVSDDSTPGIALDAPHRFIYNTMINPLAATPPCGNGVDDDHDGVADDGCPGGAAVSGDPELQRGPLIGLFLDLRAALADELDNPNPQPLATALSNYSTTKAKFDELASDCNFGAGISDELEAFADALADLANCPIGLAELGITAVIETAEAFADLVTSSLEALVDIIKDAYIAAWIEDIDTGLQHWNELGLAITQALFDPQTHRDAQNDKCDVFGTETDAARITCENGTSALDVLLYSANDFINDYLLSMAGAPDAFGDIRAALQDISAQFEFINAAINGLLNPILNVKAAIEEAIHDLIMAAIEEATGVDIEQLKSFLTHPSYWINVSDVTITLPELGSVSVHLFDPDDHERLDAYLGLDESHHTGEIVLGNLESTRLSDDAAFAPAEFAAFHNAEMLSKLSLLGAGELDRAMGDSLVDQGIIADAGSVTSYSSSSDTPVNVIYTALSSDQPWLRSIDSDHSWRANPLPLFCVEGSPDCDLPGLTPLPRPEELLAGTGEFPIWESCLLRPAFRDTFTDWENGDQQFPDLNDPASSDPSDPNAPVSVLTEAGNYVTHSGTTFVGPGHSFQIAATDQVFTDGSVSLQYRIYKDGTTPGAFIDLANGGTISIPLDAGDGVWKIDYRAQDPCHTFANEAGSGADPLAPETTQTASFTLDTTAPVITISTPPAGSIFDTDDISAIQYLLDDGALGSGVETQSVTFDGAASTNGATLDMFFLSPGTHTIVVSTADMLGNSSTLTRTFEVQATASSMRSNIERALSLGLIKNQGLANGLDAHAQAAEKAHSRGDHATEANNLTAFINHLLAQRGKGIDTATADRFIAFAQDLIAREE